jgi:magnesium chelatase family protein
MLIAAANPCPCGYFGDPIKQCTCTSHQIRKYRSRISGPLLDRIDIHIEVPRLDYKELTRRNSQEAASYQIRERIEKAREMQLVRFKGRSIFSNSQMGRREIERYCKLSEKGWKLLHQAMEKLKLSARAYDKILKLSRTIADLGLMREIETSHVAEAIQYRSLDREELI